MNLVANSRREQVSEKSRVLIVDDDATARLALAAMLRGDNLDVMFACDGWDARSRMDAISPDVVVCDFVMDQMRGDELSSWMKTHEKWRLVPFIAVTQLENPILFADLLDAGADSVVAKEKAPRMLKAQVNAALRMRRHFMSSRGVVRGIEKTETRLDAV
ncbi:MAG: response regulator [Gammaproteobacteria bacterium]